MTTKKSAQLTPPLPPPSAAEQRAIDAAVVRVSERAPRFSMHIGQNAQNHIDIMGPTHSDHQGWLARLEDAFGTRGTAFPISTLNKLMASCRDNDGKIDNVKLNGMLALIEGAKPRNEIEAALASQMAQTHTAAQQLLVRMMTVDQLPQFDSASNAANKLLRTFAMQAETLAKLQRGGEQVVKVVHVHPGAQAVIGNVTAGAAGAIGTKPGEGATHENRNRPHAKAELPAPGIEPMPKMRRKDTERVAVPIAGSERPEPLPHARRRAG